MTPCDSLSGVPVLVTGGAGFIASHLVDSLVMNGARVSVVDNLLTGSRGNLNREAEFYEMDIRNREGVLGIFRQCRPRFVFHFAAQSSVKVSVEKPHLDAEINIIGGVNILDGARASDAKRVIFASTGGALYGEVPEGQLADESWPARPMSPYAASKASFEQYLWVYYKNYRLESAVLRFANVYGPRQDPHGEAGAVSIFAARLLRREPVTLFAMNAPGDSGCIRDYVYVEDIVRASMLATMLPPGPYNVGTGVGTSTRAVIDALAEQIGITPEVIMEGPRSGDLRRSVLSAGHLSAFGWRTMTGLRDGLASTIAWVKAHHQSS